MGAGISSSNPRPICQDGAKTSDDFIDSLSHHDLSFEDSKQKIPEIMAWLTHPDRDWKSMNTHKALFFLRHYSGPLPSATSEARKSWVDGLQQSGIVERCLQWWSKLFCKSIFDKKQEDLMRNFRMVIGILWNCTEISQQCCSDFAQNDGFKTLLSTLSTSHLSPKKLQQDRTNVSRLYIAHASGTTMKNVLTLNPEAKIQFRESGGLPVCKKFLSSTLDIIKCKFLLCLAYGINEDERELVLASENLLMYLLKLLNDCVIRSDHVGKLYPFSACELVQGLNRIASNETNKLSLVQLGVMEPYGKLLSDPIDDNELEAVIKGIWTLAFQPDNRPKINNQNSFCSCADHRLITQCLKDYTVHNNPCVSEAAKGALWVLSDAAYTAVCTENNSEQGHIMISYQWHYQSLVRKMKDHLKAAGFNIWIDIEQMSGSTLESMAAAVEQSSVVLICISETYKNSPSCRTEAEYAFKLRKDIVPLRLQDKYSPDGWLGILVGTKLYFDCHSEEAILANRSALEKELSIRTRNQGPEPAQGTNRQPDETHDSSDTKFWSRKHVSEWLDRNALSDLKPLLAEFDGQIILGLQKMFFRAPNVYYTSMKEDFGLTDMVSLLRFTNALEELK